MVTSLAVVPIRVVLLVVSLWTAAWNVYIIELLVIAVFLIVVVPSRVVLLVVSLWTAACITPEKYKIQHVVISKKKNKRKMFNTEEYHKEMLARSSARVVLETVVTIVIIVTALLGNLMVCLAVFRSKKLRTVPNLYIIALAILDILMAIICMPLSVEVFFTGNFSHGELVAHIQGSFALSLPIASLQLMTAMAINRFYRIVKPALFRKYFSLRRTVISLVIIMVLGALGPCLPMIFGFAKYSLHYGKVLSYLNYATTLAAYSYTIFLKIFYITIPTLITLFCYYRIYMTVKNHSEELKANQRNNSSGGLSMNVEEVKITKPLFAAALGFVACWTPVAVVDMIDTFTHHTMHHPREVYLFYLLMGYASSSINPFIYGVLNRSFKKEFINIFRLVFSKRFSNNTEPSHSASSANVTSGRIKVAAVHPTKMHHDFENKATTA